MFRSYVPDFESMRFRIRDLRADAGLTQQELAESAGISVPFLSQIETGAKLPSMETLIRIGKALGAPASSLIDDRLPIAVAGRVGAGAAVDLVDAYEKGAGLYHIACPTDLSPRGIVAVEVTGDSMKPIIAEGDILLFSRDHDGVDEAGVGEVVICETLEGLALVKLLRRGRDPETFDLYSAKDGLEPIYGVRLKWAARLRRQIRKEDVVVVEAGA